ncbi:MAG: hypothetical protein H0U85_00190 [Gemmatimonadales bacterium]|nr:hypothetical protein [Gemmatimonadales bacterium]
MNRQHFRFAFFAALSLTCARTVRAQGLLEKLRKASADLALSGAPVTNLEQRGLTKVAIGTVTFSVSSVTMKDTTAVRIRTFLYNPGDQPVELPLPTAESFALVDDGGRRVPMIGAPKVTGLGKGAVTLTVPSLERVEIVLLFGKLAASATEATLKVGAAGMIRGIPLGAAAAGAGAAGGPTGAQFGAAPTNSAGSSSAASGFGNQAPSGSAPSGAAPSGAAPSGAAPSNAAPSSSAPSSSAPSSSVPSNSVPPDAPSGAAPAASMSSGAAPAAAAPSEGSPPSAPVALAGTWSERTTLASIHINDDGSYTANGSAGTWMATPTGVTFTGPLRAWNGGRATVADDTLQFTWSDKAGTPHHFVFTRE